MVDFNINRGPSTVLFSEPGVINPRLIIEEGYWYLCTDTAELFLGIRTEDGLTLKRINESDADDSNYTEALEALSAEIRLIKESLNDYAKKSDIPDVSDFVTKEALDAAIEAIEYPTVDLTGYATKEDLKGLLSEIPPEYVTEQELEAKGYLTEHQSLEEYVKTEDLPEFDNFATKAEIPSLDNYAKITDIPDVSKFITEVPSEYVTETELASKGFITEHQDISHLATKEEIPDVSGFITMQEVEDKNYLTEIPEGFATEEFVNKKIAEAELADKEADLEAYYTKSEVDALIPDVSSFITEIPEKYVTEDELNAKGYLTEHQDLSSYALKTDIPTDYLKEIPAEYITESELDAKGYLTAHQSLEAYAKKDELFSKSYNDLTDTPEIPSIEGLATEEFVRTEIEKIDVPTIDTTNLVTTEKLIDALAVKANEVPFTSAKFITKPLGDFTYGENINNLSIAEIFAKLLGLVDKDPNIQEPDGIIESIIKNEIPMYAVTAKGTLEEVPYKLLTFTEEEAAVIATESGFYQIRNAEGNVIESGYQELQAKSDEVYYVIALPKDIDYGSMVSVKAWDTLKNQWTDTGSKKFELTSDPEAVAVLCDEAGIDISHIDTSVYTVWALEDSPTGSKLRFVINE